MADLLTKDFVELFIFALPQKGPLRTADQLISIIFECFTVLEQELIYCRTFFCFVSWMTKFQVNLEI